MKTLLLPALAAMTLFTTSGQAAPARKHPAAKSAPVVTIPKSAVKTDDGYRYVDARGKVWIYRETPFGITKAAYKAPEPVPAADPAKDTRVTAEDAGESVDFARTGPFGVSHWRKKKTDLTPDEQAIWDRVKK